MEKESYMIIWYGEDGAVINALNADDMTHEEASALEKEERPSAALGHDLRCLGYMKQTHSITITATFKAQVPGVPSGALAAVMSAKCGRAAQALLSEMTSDLSEELTTLCKRYGISEDVLYNWREYNKKPLLDTNVEVR